MTELPVIDAHLHLWNRAASDYAWITPALGPLDADFGAAQAFGELAAAGIGSAILVQADDTVADTRFMLDIAALNAWVVGVVGWVPLGDPDAAARMLADTDGLCGIRQLIHNDPRDVLADPLTIETLHLVAEAELAWDVPDAWPRHLGQIGGIAASVPELTIVIDHLGKPGAPFEAWESAFRDAAAHPNTVAKLSGLQSLPPDVLRRAWDIALDAFGPARLLYGGDWPMTVPHGGYAASWARMSGLVGELSLDEQRDILAGTARRTYRLEP